MERHKKKEVDAFIVDNPPITPPLLLNSGRPGEPSVEERRPTHQPNSLPDPAVNARCSFAYVNEQDDPKGIKGFLLQEHADTGTSVASLADAHASVT